MEGASFARAPLSLPLLTPDDFDRPLEGNCDTTVDVTACVTNEERHLLAVNFNGDRAVPLAEHPLLQGQGM